MQAGDAARGGTAVVTLEPCAHTGRTGPCADALVNAGVGAVVAAMEDPNPLVSGRGFARLRAAGADIVLILDNFATAQAVAARGEALVLIRSTTSTAVFSTGGQSVNDARRRVSNELSVIEETLAVLSDPEAMAALRESLQQTPVRMSKSDMLRELGLSE